jgi:hypothetical protein
MFPFAMAAMYGLQALGGVIAGKNGQKTINPDVLKRLFGPQALTAEVMETFHRLINSPMAQQMVTEAAQNGTIAAHAMQSSAAQMSGDSTSGASQFANAAASSAPEQGMANVRKDIAGAAEQIGAQNLRDRMSAYVGSQMMQQQQPSTGQIIGGSIAGAAGNAIAGMDQKPSAPGNAAVAIPQKSYALPTATLTPADAAPVGTGMTASQPMAPRMGAVSPSRAVISGQVPVPKLRRPSRAMWGMPGAVSRINPFGR